LLSLIAALLPAPLCVSAIWNVYSALLVPFDVHFQLGLLCKACQNTLFDLCSAWLNCIGPRWCWVVITAVGCRPMRFLFRHNRSIWCWILITLQFKPQELSDLYSATNMSVCADANITGTFLLFGRTKFIINFNKVHYKISTMVAFCPGGLLSVHPLRQLASSDCLADGRKLNCDIL